MLFPLGRLTGKDITCTYFFVYTILSIYKKCTQSAVFPNTPLCLHFYFWILSSTHSTPPKQGPGSHTCFQSQEVYFWGFSSQTTPVLPRWFAAVMVASTASAFNEQNGWKELWCLQGLWLPKDQRHTTCRCYPASSITIYRCSKIWCALLVLNKKDMTKNSCKAYKLLSIMLLCRALLNIPKARWPVQQTTFWTC